MGNNKLHSDNLLCYLIYVNEQNIVLVVDLFTVLLKPQIIYINFDKKFGFPNPSDLIYIIKTLTTSVKRASCIFPKKKLIKELQEDEGESDANQVVSKTTKPPWPSLQIWRKLVFHNR